jgi:hypothetical protein
MQRRPQLGRPRRNGRANMKTRVGIAASILALGGGAAAVVVASSHGSAPSAAQSASYHSGYGSGSNRWSGMSEYGLLSSAMNGWSSSRTTSMSQLASVSSQTLSQTTRGSKTLDEQRGTVVFADSQFLILQSKNGSLHLWVLSGKTQFSNVSDSTTGTTAMTANSTASTEAVNGGEMIPAVNTMAGGATTLESLLTPSSRPQTSTVQVAGTDLTVTVTITENTATTTSTATMPTSTSAWPTWHPTTSTMSAWSTAGTSSSLARGDLALVVGSRSHGLLHASIVLFTPVSAGDVGGFLGGGTTTHPVATPTPTTSVTPTTPATPVPTPSMSSGTHY